MRHDKEKAIKLRKTGRSFNEIKALLGVPKSTLSEWFRSQNWSAAVKKKLNEQNLLLSSKRFVELARIRGEHLESLYREAETEAVEEFNLLKYHPLFVSGLMIYWGEGDKLSRYRCSIANSEPLMIKLFLEFLTKVCGLKKPKIKAWILLYPDLDDKVCKEYWMNNTGLKTDDFNKTILIKGKNTTRRLGHGVCTVGVSSAYLKIKILTWISLLAQDLLDENYMRA